MTDSEATKSTADLAHNPQGQAPYAALTPELILTAVERLGYEVSGAFLALNSYENRVYQVETAPREFVVVKFYRPGRWSDAAILEEHAFAAELLGHEIPVIGPLADTEGMTLFYQDGFRYAVYPRRGGRWPDLENAAHLEQLGRFLGRIHAVGAIRPFQSRPYLTVESYGWDSYRFLQTSGFIPQEVLHNYCQAAEALLTEVETAFAGVPSLPSLRLHGDCHPGNILWGEQGPHFVDLDDCCQGPAIQDLWMLLSGSGAEMRQQVSHLLAGYNQFYDFDPVQLRLVEPLRALRMIHYCAWLARRWHDPAFPLHFPWFNTPRYWEEQLQQLREQMERLTYPEALTAP